MNEKTLSADDLAKRFGVSRPTISRWQEAGRLPEPVAGPRKYGVRWTEAAIRAWEKAGFAVHGPEKWRADLKRVELAQRCMGEVLKVEGVNESAAGLARAGKRLLSNPLVPLKSRVEIARHLLNCDWAKALEPMDATDKVKTAKVRHLLNTLHRQHGGRTDE